MSGRSRKNSEVHATQVSGSEIGIEKVKEQKGFDVAEFLGLSAKIAKSTIYTGNRKFKNADKHFPNLPLLRTVQKFFPYADGGPLYVDEPTDPQEERECAKKAVALKAEGLRYVVITRDMHDRDESDVLEELKAVA